jgi:hypothetical protein
LVTWSVFAWIHRDGLIPAPLTAGRFVARLLELQASEFTREMMRLQAAGAKKHVHSHGESNGFVDPRSLLRLLKATQTGELSSLTDTAIANTRLLTQRFEGGDHRIGHYLDAPPNARFLSKLLAAHQAEAERSSEEAGALRADGDLARCSVATLEPQVSVIESLRCEMERAKPIVEIVEQWKRDQRDACHTILYRFRQILLKIGFAWHDTQVPLPPDDEDNSAVLACLKQVLKNQLRSVLNDRQLRSLH